MLYVQGWSQLILTVEITWKWMTNAPFLSMFTLKTRSVIRRGKEDFISLSTSWVYKKRKRQPVHAAMACVVVLRVWKYHMQACDLESWQVSPPPQLCIEGTAAARAPAGEVQLSWIMPTWYRMGGSDSTTHRYYFCHIVVLLVSNGTLCPSQFKKKDWGWKWCSCTHVSITWV